MTSISTILVEVQLLSSDEQILSKAQVAIELPANGKLQPAQLIDACQRSVASCLDVLEPQLEKQTEEST